MAEVYRYVEAAGFRTGEEAITMTAIVFAESGGRTDAVGRNTNGTTDTGLAQINSIHRYPAADLLDPAKNLAAARAIATDSANRGKSPFYPWVAWTTGAHRKFLADAMKAAVLGGGSNNGGGLAGAAGGVLTTVAGGAETVAGGGLGAVTSTIGGLKALADFVALLMKWSTWERVLLVLGGAGLIAGGLSMAGADLSGVAGAAQKVLA